MALAVARKSSFRDSIEEQVSTMSLANLSGIWVCVGDYPDEVRIEGFAVYTATAPLTRQLKKKWLLWAIEA
jgi:hypothetical protein